MRRGWVGILLAVTAAVLTGCSDLVDQDQVKHTAVVRLEPGKTNL